VIAVTSYILLGDMLEHLFKYKKMSKDNIAFLRYQDRLTLDKVIVIGEERSCLRIEGNEVILLKPIEFLLLLEELTTIDAERLARHIEWSDFERYVAEKLRLMGFDYISSYKHNRIMRFQIDVLALDLVGKVGYIVECKHWRKIISSSQIRQIVKDHTTRVEKFLKSCEWVSMEVSAIRKVKYFIPLILTLYAQKVYIYNGVPIVALRFLEEFLAKADTYADVLEVRKYVNRCYVS
jgi:hypothetical protein